jgi:Mrp family chromosome partitioning ATPase
MVVVDLPPLSAGSEKLAVSSLFDGIIVTAAWGKTPLDALGELVGTLHAVKAPLIGVLLTNVRYISTKRSNNRARQIPS